LLPRPLPRRLLPQRKRARAEGARLALPHGNALPLRRKSARRNIVKSWPAKAKKVNRPALSPGRELPVEPFDEFRHGPLRNNSACAEEDGARAHCLCEGNIVSYQNLGLR